LILLLSDKIKIHLTHLFKMENGCLLLSIEIVQRVKKVFAVRAENLLNDNENSVVYQSRRIKILVFFLNRPHSSLHSIVLS
jgi:hypothetical protein